jgi:hypothetical protein
LDDKLTKLASFISSSSLFAGLAVEDQNLLRQQRGVMGEYSAILSNRIARFAS